MSEEVQTPKVAKEVAAKEVAAMLATLEAEPESAGDIEVLVSAAMAGRLSFDRATEKGEYVFAKPVELENGATFDRLKFRELNAGEIESISKGTKLEVSANGMGTMDLGALAIRTARFVHKMTDFPIGVADRIKKRDLVVIKAILGFLS
jgi:hypothetical protein